jgi:hypothetical protein
LDVDLLQLSENLHGPQTQQVDSIRPGAPFVSIRPGKQRVVLKSTQMPVFGIFGNV